jgi:hypothetical protein
MVQTCLCICILNPSLLFVYIWSFTFLEAKTFIPKPFFGQNLFSMRTSLERNLRFLVAPVWLDSPSIEKKFGKGSFDYKGKTPLNWCLNWIGEREKVLKFFFLFSSITSKKSCEIHLQRNCMRSRFFCRFGIFSRLLTQLQGCQIVLATIYQNGKYIPSNQKIYQMALQYTNWH